MKRILLLTLIIVLATAASYAQSDINNLVPMAPTATMTYSEAPANIHAPSDRGVEFFCEDFAFGFEGNNGVGAFTFSDNGIEDIWTIGTSADNPLSEGQYSINSGSANTTSGDNGYALFDMDGYNTEYELYPGAPSISGYLNFPTLDMTSLETVIVEWQSYFRYCCFPFSPLTLEVSVDGGDTWAIFEGHGSFVESTNTASVNGAVNKMDISCIAAGESAVDLRYAYNSEIAEIFVDFGFAYSTYWWVIDDICIYTNPVEDDLEITQVTNGDIFNVWEYLHTPLEQAITEDNGGLLVGTVYKNTGANDALDVTLTIEILNEDQSEVLSTTVSDPFDLLSNLNSLVCPQEFDTTAYIETGWVPETTGKYWVRSTIAADGITDATPENNILEKWFTYTDDEYGHDDGDELDTQTRPSETSSGSGEFNPTGTGNFYHMPNEGTTGYGALVHFGPACDEGPDFELRCYYYDNEVGLNASVYDETFYELPEAWIPQGSQELWVYLPFEDPIEMFADEAYFIALVHDFIDTNEFAVNGDSDSDTDNSTALYALSGGGDMTWFTSQTFSPAVRLITSERVGIEDIAISNGILLEQNVPNPASGETAINYNLTWSRDVKFDIHDLSGRIIETIDLGVQVPGGHTLNLDISSYPMGVYYYTLSADEYQTTRKMVVGAE